MTERWCFAVCQPEEDRGRWTWWEMTFEKKKKREVAGEEETVWKASGLDNTSQGWLLPQLRKPAGVRGTLVAFSACFNKARTEWDRGLSPALEMLSHKQQAKDWSCCRSACVTCTPYRYITVFTPCHRSHPQAHPQTSTAAEPGQIAVAEDTWWNHQSQKDPSGQIKSVLMWAECNASRVKTGPSWLEGMRARRGFSLHPQANQSRGLERGCGFQRPTGTPLPLVTDSSVLQSILQRDEKQLEGWRGRCSNPHLFSANPSSETSWLFASASGMEELWCSVIKVTLGCCES